MPKRTNKESNDAVKNEIMNELCLNSNNKIKDFNFGFKKSIVEKIKET